MSKRSLQELVNDTVEACRNPFNSDFDPSVVAVCPPHWIHLFEQRVIAELDPGIDQDGIYLRLLGLDEGFGYKARRI